MTIQIKYFGMLTDITQCSTETIDVLGNNIFDVLEVLFNKYPTLRANDFRVAQGQKIIPKTTPIDGSEIALLPPFSGG